MDEPWRSPNGGREYAAVVYHRPQCQSYLAVPRRWTDNVAHLLDMTATPLVRAASQLDTAP